MAACYCHPCSAKLGLLNDVYTSEPLGTQYQLTKFMKHTVPSTCHDVVSVFESTSTGRYEQYVVDAGASGAVEIDDRGRRNIVYLAGERAGFRWERGVLQGPQDGIKVVLSSESGRVHAFPIEPSALRTGRCTRCGGPIAT